MSDDKTQKDSPKSDGTGSDAGTATTDPGNKATTFGFGELLGAIDSRIDAAVRKATGKGGENSGTKSGTTEDPQSVAEQVRQEIAKLSGEKAAADKDAARDVSIQELKDRMDKISEEKPIESVSRLTAFMWGKKQKS